METNSMKAKITLASITTVVIVGLVVGSLSVVPREVQATPKVLKVNAEKLPDDAITIEEIARDGDRTLLRVQNRTPFIVIVYVGGVRIGWVRPYRKGLIRGLMRGHHRLYAHSRYGTTSWGPRFIWIPGTWNLLY
jgi:hypothetical protein